MIFCEYFGGIWIVAVCIILYNTLLENLGGIQSTKRTFIDDT